MRRWAGRTRWLAFTVASALTVLTGCDGFFVPVVPPPPPGSTGNYAYVANFTASSVSGFSLDKGALKNVPNSPVALGYQPVALAVTPNNKFLYVAAQGNINMYTINTDGSLTGASGGTGVAIVDVISMDISPDGQWLLALNASPLLAQISVFRINASTGALTSAEPGKLAIPDAVIVPKMVRISPNGAFVFAALGTGGDVVFNFDTTTGVLFNSQKLQTGDKTSDNGLAVDSATANLYVARSGTGGGVAVYSIGVGGTLTPVKGSPFASGGQAYSVALDNTEKFLYAANRLNGTIYGYSIGAGPTLTALDGSPYASGQQVTSLGMERSGKYLLAAAFGGAPDLSMYSFDTTIPGKLILAGSTATSVNPAGAIAVALTH